MNRFSLFLFTSLLLLFNTSNVAAFEGRENESTFYKQRLASNSAFLEKRQEIKEDFKERLNDAREKNASRAAEFKANLEKIRDERKKKIVENVSARISDRNEAWVLHWKSVLDRLVKIIDKMETKVTEFKEAGKDTSEAKTAVSKARTAISDAQAKVNTQAGKTYPITITTEAGLGKDVSLVVNTFHTDVEAVIESINAARSAVRDAFNALKAISK